jgi:hypothetical protein
MTLATDDLLDGLARGDGRVGHERELRRALEAGLCVDGRLDLRPALFERVSRLGLSESKKTIAWRRSWVVSTPVTVTMPMRSSKSEMRVSSSEMTSRRI